MTCFPKISVLIPVYNVEPFLKRCLDSVVNQTFADYEVVLVDDGSSDGSGQICDEYAHKYAFVKVYHNPNQGISATREFALQCASGEYIQFVDSDDWIELDMLEVMYKKALEENADVVGCNFFEEYEGYNREIDVAYESKEQFLRAVVGDQWGVVWKLLIRKDIVILNDVHFPPKINGGEDYVFVVQILFFARSVTSVREAFYHYNRINAGSTISNPSYTKIKEQIEATNIVDRLLIEWNLESLYLNEILQRKFFCKLPLLAQHYYEWKTLFPECNVLFGKLAGKKNKIRLLVCKMKEMFGLEGM